MKYLSTRGKVSNITFEEAVMMGLATDGGLIIPETIPALTQVQIAAFSKLKYTDLAFEIMRLFVGGYNLTALKSIIDKSYNSTFDSRDIIPVVKSKSVQIAELFHGPTFAFKDFALQFLGNLFEDILSRSGSKLNIIGATSGDTGSAAIYGVKGKKNINIFILYPDGKVSITQEGQMTTVPDENVYTLAVKGDFDDCQNIVKELFNDIDFKNNYNLGAVNSINWARVLAQVVYYFYIYFRSAKTANDKINFVVPTGNFGNIFACFIAKKMGLNIGKIVLASNENDILFRAVNNGDYSVKGTSAHETYSPSMDIQVASNFERYLYYLYGNDANKVNDIMSSFKSTKRVDLTAKLPEIQSDFIAGRCSNDECIAMIKEFYRENKYILDPHTACGVAVAKKLNIYDSDTVCLATAHVAKFSDIANAVDIKIVMPDAFLKIEKAEKRVTKIDNDKLKVKEYIIGKLK